MNSESFYHSLYTQLSDFMQEPPFTQWHKALSQQIETGLSEQRFGDLPAWRSVLERLPAVTSTSTDFKDAVVIGSEEDCCEQTQQTVKTLLQELIPWRKGPFTVHGTFIDTEWRSDKKWERLIPHIAPLKNRLVLDVGCGNGYYAWRMLGEGAKRVIGIDPSPRFVMQFYCLKHFTGPVPADVLPVGIESVPDGLRAFDTVFSMGVLYHRRSPMDHLRELKDTLRRGGQLVLETLVIEGKQGEVLVPEGRYAMMNNVWFIPSCETLLSWMRKCGFKQPRVVDISRTRTEEQRATEWMHFHSLDNFLDPENPDLTVEGHPAPTRAVLLAEAP